jgi:hypothetical protein
VGLRKSAEGSRVGVGKDLRVVVGVGASVSTRVNLGTGEAIKVVSSTVWSSSSGVRLAVKEGSVVSVGSAKGAATGALDKNGRQATSETTIVNNKESVVRDCMKQV